MYIRGERLETGCVAIQMRDRGIQLRHGCGDGEKVNLREIRK